MRATNGVASTSAAQRKERASELIDVLVGKSKKQQGWGKSVAVCRTSRHLLLYKAHEVNG
jgi:hypothetical protein